MKYRFKHIVEYGVLRAIAGLACILPYRAALGLGALVAFPSFWLSKKRRLRVDRRLCQVFGDRYTARERRRIGWIAWRNLCFNAVESMRVPLVTLDWVKQVTDYVAVEDVAQLLDRGSGVVLALPHMGNWELAGVALQLFTGKLVTIVRRQKNLLVDAYLHRMRTFTGVDAIYRDARSFAGVVHRLRDGYALGIPVDLRAKGPAARVRYLGSETDIPTGAAHFARQAGVPILPVYVLRKGWGRHVWRTGELIHADPSADKDADLLRMTQQIMDVFDRVVREHPEQYFWFNKRWVLGKEPS